MSFTTADAKQHMRSAMLIVRTGLSEPTARQRKAYGLIADAHVRDVLNIACEWSKEGEAVLDHMQDVYVTCLDFFARHDIDGFPATYREFVEQVERLF